MINQFLKMAGVKTQAEFYKKYPTEAAFFRAHPQARKMAEGGDASAQGGGDQQTQLLQGVAQMLQQGAQPEQVMQQLVQMGMPQDQAVQVIQMVMQQMQGAQQQPAMRYGGIPRADMGMSVPAFGTGMIETLPNVENYPSYNAYKQAYNEYLGAIDTTTTINWDDFTKGTYEADVINTGDTLVDNLMNRIESNLIGGSDTLDKITPDASEAASNSPISTLKPTAELEAKRQKEIDEKTGSGDNPWLWAGAGAAGLLAARYALYPFGKNVYKFGQRKLGTVPEVDQSKLTKEQQLFNKQRISEYQSKIVNRGYTTGKSDVNELVLRGMSRAEAQTYIDNIPDKTGKTKKPATPATTPPAVDPMVAEIGQLMDHDYYKNALNDPNLDPAKRADFEMRVNQPDSWLKNEIINWEAAYQRAIADGDAAAKASAKSYIDKYTAQLKQLDDIKTKYATPAPVSTSSTPGAASTTSVTSTPNSTTPASNSTSTPATQSATQQTKEKIQTKRNTPPAGKSQAVIASEKEANKIISEMISSKKSTAAQMNRLNALGVDDVTIMRRLKGKNVIPSGSFAGKNKYIVSGMDAAANITKLLEEIKIARAAGKLREVGEIGEALRILRKIPKKFGGEYAMGGYVPEYAAQAYGAYNLPQYEMGSYYEDGGSWNGTWNGNQGFAYGGSNPFEDNPLRRFVYAEGGMSPEQAMMMQQQQGAPQEQGGGEDAQMQQIIEAVVNMLEEGMQPQEIMQKLVEAGLPQEMAQQVIQHVMEDQQGGGQEQQMPPQGGGGMPEEMMQGMQQAPMQEGMEGQMPMQMYGGFAYGGTPRFPDGGEPCYDQQGNVIPCEEKRLKELGSDAYTAMQPFYETLYSAANKYKNPRTGMVSPFNSTRATAKAFIKHPGVLFMKRHQLPSELYSQDPDVNPYHVQGYDMPTPLKTIEWSPSQWAEPRRERNTGGGFENFKMRLREKAEERRNRRNRGRYDCASGNCTEEEMQMSAYGGEHRIGDEIEVSPAQLEELRRKGIKFEIIN